jgi:uncharacterized protein YjbI with pentapeptide repeats
VLWAIRIVLVLVVLLAILTLIGLPFGITLWAWVKLLIVPAVLAIGGYLFTRSESRATQAAAERRAQDEALHAYLDQMSAMLIPNQDQPSLYKARPGDSLSSVARARTLTVLPRLDSDRKARVVQFLHESGLIAKNHPILALRGADLRGANLFRADLKGSDLGWTDLRGAMLHRAQLSEAILSRADLKGADLSLAHLEGTDLSRSILSLADLSYANLSSTDLSVAMLSETNLSNAILSETNLSNAILSETNLSGADMRGASAGALLSGVDMSGAILSESILRGLEELTNAELEEQAKFLKGATAPNGQQYEEWLKSKNREEDE